MRGRAIIVEAVSRPLVRFRFETLLTVLGMHRSGTSTITGMLEDQGIDAGPANQYAPDNGEIARTWNWFVSTPRFFNATEDRGGIHHQGASPTDAGTSGSEIASSPLTGVVSSW
jgi:hypothetical protein